MTPPLEPDDDWNDDDHYPMHPGHPGWNDRSPTLLSAWRAVTVVFVVLASASAVVIAVRFWSR